MLKIIISLDEALLEILCTLKEAARNALNHLIQCVSPMQTGKNPAQAFPQFFTGDGDTSPF